MFEKIEVKPFKGLKIIQTIEDIENVDCQFGDGRIVDNSYLECQDCFSTDVIYKVIIEAELSMDVVNETTVNITNKNIQALGASRCYHCDGVNIERVNYNLGHAKKEQSKRLVPRC